MGAVKKHTLSNVLSHASRATIRAPFLVRLSETYLSFANFKNKWIFSTSYNSVPTLFESRTSEEIHV